MELGGEKEEDLGLGLQQHRAPCWTAVGTGWWRSSISVPSFWTSSPLGLYSLPRSNSHLESHSKAVYSLMTPKFFLQLEPFLQTWIPNSTSPLRCLISFENLTCPKTRSWSCPKTCISARCSDNSIFLGIQLENWMSPLTVLYLSLTRKLSFLHSK